MIPYDELPPDMEPRRPLHFIRTEVAARAGAITTGATTGIAFLDRLDPMVKFAAGVIALLVGLATLTYYCLAIAEKWRGLKREDDDDRP